MSSNRTYFKVFLRSAFDEGEYTTDDVIAFVLPLFREVCGLHEAGLVAPFGKEEVLFLTEQALDIDEQQARAPSYALRRVLALFPGVQSANFEVVGKIKLRADAGEDAIEQENLQVHLDFGQPLSYPSYVPGYQCFEQLLGHHDPQTDIFCLGLILGSMALGLDLYEPDDLVSFARIRSNPSQYNDRLHPTVVRLITEMTELDRSRRTQDLYDVIEHLQHYRDYDPEKQTDLSRVAGWVNKELRQRDAFILNKLRNRLFDTSRRNRLLYYKPNMRFVNLTVSSVPVVLHYQSIRPEHLFTWNEELAEKFRGMKEIVLNKYLRFDDHAYLPSSLDRVRVESQRAIQEYGFNQLKLVIAFLNWHNLKEDPNERIQSPLLLLPVSLKKNKKLKEDHYVLKVLDNAAEVNPVLAGQLKDLYGIRLPDLVDLDETDPAQFYQSVKAQIDEANQGIVLNYISKPRIRLIHGEARQTVHNYRKRLRRQPGLSSHHHIPYSYKPEHYQPLGLEIFRQRIGTEKGFLEFLVQGGRKSAPKRLMETAEPVAREVERDLPARDPAVREAELYKLAESENNPYTWDFDVCHMVLGNFNYKKMSLVRDYNVVIDQQLQHPVFDALFSEQPRTFKEHPFDLNRTDDWHHVIQADPTQARAILQGRAGYSYIIQGPPGTGKSQTITNLIADYVARGKSILFVCEKRAALDVVYHRLKQNGLDELCCYIHDSQEDKREFIRNLRSTYEDFTARRMDLPGLRAQRAALVDRMNRQVDLLKEFHVTSTGGEQEIGITVRKLIERIIELRPDLVALSALEEEALPAYAAWQAASGVVHQLTAALEEAGSDPIFAGHPFSKVHERIFLAEHPHRMLDAALGQALDLLDAVDRKLAGARVAQEHRSHPARLKSLVQFAVLLHPLVLTDNFRLADPSGEEARTFIRRFNEYKSQQETYQEALRKNIHWKEKLVEQDLSHALDLAVKQEKAFLNFLNGGWQKLKKQLQACYDFSAHAVKPSYRSILEHLKDEYEQARLLEQVKRRLREDYRLDNPDTAWLGIGILHQKKDDPSLVYLLRHPEAGAVVISLHSLHQPLVDLESRLKECLHDPGAPESLEGLRDELQNIRLNADGLREMLPALRRFTELPEGVKSMLRGLMLSPRQAEAVIARKALQTVYQSNREFARIDRPALDKAVQALGECYAELQQVNADLIRAFIRQRFLQQMDLANMAASQLNEEQKKFKKVYNEGRKILENEFGKSMRYKSIRELSSRESGRVLKDIKPVWLMSPYSVSDSLPLDSDHFDVVIFDEASQITLEEGVPALYRSRQTIIVGDEKQMPPTDFFSAKAEDPDDLEGLADGEEDEWLSDDVDSLLAQGARKLDSTLLSWHYRSHYETLISFSNHAFYEGRLLTIPDKTIHKTEKPPILVSNVREASQQTDYLFDRSISYHFLEGSVYEKRSNQGEAVYIAHLVRELLRREAKESIGIVAFSQEQQHVIEGALSSLGEEDGVFAQQLEEAYNRTENDQFTGLIVKNLENIQGDERDIIIMSVCYGPDARGRMLMNFGPINKKGGEKRLNVLFSRARTHMAVVSSIRHGAITNEYNEGANYLKRFLQYAEMVSLGQMQGARSILDSLVLRKQEGPADSRPSLVRQQIRQQLQALGYVVDEQIGQSDFKCSLAVKARPEDPAYRLGILLDDDRHYLNDNLIEQYYQRPAILERFGWKVLQVFSRDWLHQPQKIMEHIRKLLERQASHELQATSDKLQVGRDVELQATSFKLQVELGQELSAGVGVGTGGYAGASPYDQLPFRRLYQREGNNERFWEAAVDGNKLVVRWGKRGAKGQIQLKTFPDGEVAQAEMEKLILEKRRSGYED
ncbi:AAA domain-containing protein [Flavitalea sp. BT771]|uniref:AAA domain-containing protein n=1 Tax=Flavitalea sp. BT771 TaxID=3063329 RepID=UPI0026E42E14|nr:AAA domain-containing protein [Flavitalea sp. BT771]MDO6433415.1 AAA domain-containing protein [Flavitalea sp. BT771]MDV6222680.1 AAA domain-containing protein [Flavitalea sp. BT771]